MRASSQDLGHGASGAAGTRSGYTGCAPAPGSHARDYTWALAEGPLTGRMRVQSIAVGTPRKVFWEGREVLTSIFKVPIPGPVMARREGIDGDRQSDLRVHGGEFKAVYAYASEHYDWWQAALGRRLEPAQFGETLTLGGLDDERVCIGDCFGIGKAELEATGPRLPCFKLGLRFGDPGVVKAFAESRRWGVYFRVTKEGHIAVGDPVRRVRSHPEQIPVHELARVRVFDRDDLRAMRRLAALEVLDPSWRGYLAQRLECAEKGG